MSAGPFGADPAAAAADLLVREAGCLDARDWDGWLALYAPDAVYHVPAWLDEDRPTSDPDTQISQIYHDSRAALAERVARARSDKSVTALPLPRTTHFVTNLTVRPPRGNTLEVCANWMVQVYEPRTARQYANFGRYDVVIGPGEDGLCIRRKTIVLNNDRVPTLIDFYTL